MNDQQCPSDEQLPEDYLTGFNAVKAELCARFGPDNGVVNYSPIPLYLDPQRGLAESLSFSGYVAGVACCTCPLSLYPQQKRGPDGFYELMMCTREPSPFAANVIGRLAPYSFQAVLKPGDTIDVGPEQSPGSTMRGLLCAKPDTGFQAVRPGLYRVAADGHYGRGDGRVPQVG